VEQRPVADDAVIRGAFIRSEANVGFLAREGIEERRADAAISSLAASQTSVGQRIAERSATPV
jgi:hypothetical protein